MGLSASQARFLQLTARKSNVEYQAQQINFQRLQLSDKLSQASSQYQDKTSNQKLVFTYNNGTGQEKIDVTYTNYKNYMNQQMEGLTTNQQKYYLVSSSGNKIIVSSEEERRQMIESHKTVIKKAVENNVQEQEASEVSADNQEDGNTDLNTVQTQEIEETIYTLKEEDFLIVDDLNDVDAFQEAIKTGVYFFATMENDSQTGDIKFKTQSWDVLGAGTIREEYDKADDAQAEAEYKALQSKVQTADKKLELELNKLETERDAIQTEIESITKVIDDNIDKSFKTFS